MADDDLVDTIVVDIETAAQAGEFDNDIDAVMGEVVTIWRGYAPEDSGAYKESIQIVDAAEAGHGAVAALDDKANLIEYGTDDTPEFAPMRRTVEEMNRRAGTE
ncbi:hypothetical protein [Mycolicibacterium sp.]|uniref:hypothetical protein n=1 Tax=Mycolicibacterium sp. TaxID=2320850 RepID=UPI0025F6BB0C|nr:hypothetical protein [Mycolicibacterium sp.]